MAWPPTTHQDVQDAVTTLQAAYVRVFTPAAYGTVDLTGAADSAAAVQAAINAASAAGGGTVLLPAGTIKVASQLSIPNDAATPPKQTPIRLIGQGAHFSGRGTAIDGGTVLNLTGTVSDSTGKIRTTGLGLLAVQGVTFTDTSGGSAPFVYTTNTTLHIDGCAFIGSKSATACDQDAIILGGPNQIEGGGGLTDGFQGYGTVISRNYFGGIRRAVVGQAFANGVQVTQNTIWATCGNASGAAIEWDGKPTTGTQSAAGGSIRGNLIELYGYQYGIRARNAVGINFVANDFYDPGSIAAAGIYLEASALDCNVVAGYSGGGLQYLIDDSSTTLFQEINASGVSSVDPKPRIYRGLVRAAGWFGAGVHAMDWNGNAAYVKAQAPWSGTVHAQVFLGSKPATQVTDGVTTNGSVTVTSATAGWTSADQGMPIGGAGILLNTYIAQVVSGTQIRLTQAATATGAGVRLSFGRLGTEIQQIGFEKQHIIAQGNPPTVAAGTAAGTGRSASLTGADVAGTITVTTGTGTAPGTLAQINFSTAHSGTAHIMLTPANQAAAQTFATGMWTTYLPGSAWTMSCVAAPPASTDLLFSYTVIEAA